MQFLELRIPPPIVALPTDIFQWLSALLARSAVIALPRRQWLAIAIAAAGFVVSISGVLSFRRAKTTVNPLQPPNASSLVTSGIYRMTRNPMYLGLLLV